MKNKSTLKRLMAFCRPYRIYLVGALLFSTINIIFTLLTPILIGKAIDPDDWLSSGFLPGTQSKNLLYCILCIDDCIIQLFLS